MFSGQSFIERKGGKNQSSQQRASSQNASDGKLA